MQITNKSRNAVDFAFSNKDEDSPTTDRVFYTTTPRVNGIKFMLHELLRSRNQGHLVRTRKPGEPRKIIIKALPKNQYSLNLPKKGEETKGGGVSKIINTTVSRNNPPAGKSLPCDEALRCIDSILNDPVVPPTPALPKKKRKRKRKRRKNRESSPIQHESKDKKGKNKSTKHIPSPAVTVVSGSSPASNHPSTSHYSSPSKAPGPSNELSNIAESTMGSLTQAIFRGKSYRGDQGSKSCINVSSSSSSSIDLDVIPVPPTPSPIAFPRQVNLTRTADVGKKRSANEVHVEVSLKRVKETGRDQSVISLKEVSCQTEKQHDESHVVELENHMKRNSDTSTSGTSFSKNTDKAQLHEISSCTEADVSSHLGALPEVHQKVGSLILACYLLEVKKD